jgi:diguanylate cyclase (GGDEF)-like protein
MKISRRTQTITAWAYPSVAVVAAVCFLFAGSKVQSSLVILSMVSVFPAGYFAARVNRLPRTLTWGMAAVGFLYILETAAAEIFASDAPVSVADSIDLIATTGIIGIIVYVVQRRRGGLTAGDVLDGVIIGAGAWLGAWILLVQPYLSQSSDSSTIGIVVSAMHIPLSMIILALATLLLFGGGRPRPSIVLVTAGLGFNIAGDLIYALEESRALGSWAYTVADALYLISVAACAAAIVHPSAHALVGESTSRRRVPLPGRLAVTASALIIPVALVTLIPASSFADRTVRSAAAITIVMTVAVRFHRAARAQIHSQDELAEVAYTDELTRLPNKRALFEMSREAIGDLWTTEHQPSFYLYDIDRFKNINDATGHSIGDEVLRLVAKRLQAAAGSIGATVTRSSGDEFIVFDSTPTDQDEAMHRAKVLHGVFDQSVVTSGGDVFVTASCGVACMIPGSPTPSEDLFRWADIAMYQAKANGRNRVVLYEPAMQEHVARRMTIERSLRGALQRRELHLFHQPIIDVATGAVTGVEALMRWRRSDGSVVSPATFIPIAEETGLIDEIGSWAVLEALSTLRGWIDEGIVSDSTTISVNVSPRQLADPRFTSVVQEALDRSRMPPHLLWLEVTETAMVENAELAKAVLQEIRATGVRIALDDFGTGYSSLSLLQQFPIQRIKIDRAFVSSIDDNDNDRNLVRTIVGLGESMGVDIVAEGVETVMQLRQLRQLGCPKAQGFLISHPVPAEAMRSTVRALESLSQWPEFAQLMGD